jgi:hypothetical protein
MEHGTADIFHPSFSQLSTKKNMEDLLQLAAHCGLSKEDGEETTCALLSVLKKSKNLEKDRFQEILQGISGSEDALKQHERGNFRKNLPNPAMMLLPRPGLAPPGPPPPVVIMAAAKGIGKAFRKDKDAGNTKDIVTALTKNSVDEANILTFIPVFILFVKEQTDIDVGEIVCLPVSSDDAGEDQSNAAT